MAAATIASPAPEDAPGLDFFTGNDEARKEYEMLLSDRAAWERAREQERDELLALSVQELVEEWASAPE